MTATSHCPDCYRPVHERPDSLCATREQHTGQAQPAPWGSK